MRIHLRLAVALALLCSLSCTCDHKNHGKADDMAQRSIEEVQKENAPGWLSIEGVVGTAIGSSESAKVIHVYVSERTPQIDEAIPDTVEGYPVVIIESGEMRALDSE
jgi:hypothetical protein